MEIVLNIVQQLDSREIFQLTHGDTYTIAREFCLTKKGRECAGNSVNDGVLTREIAASPNSRSLPLIATITGVFRRLSLAKQID